MIFNSDRESARTECARAEIQNIMKPILLLCTMENNKIFTKAVFNKKNNVINKKKIHGHTFTHGHAIRQIQWKRYYYKEKQNMFAIMYNHETGGVLIVAIVCIYRNAEK